MTVDTTVNPDNVVPRQFRGSWNTEPYEQLLKNAQSIQDCANNRLEGDRNAPLPNTKTLEHSWDGGRMRIRIPWWPGDDLGMPVFVVNSELEAIACYDVRQDERIRFAIGSPPESVS